MITLEQAKKKALDYMGAGLEIAEANELPGKWVFSFRNAETKEESDISPVRCGLCSHTHPDRGPESYRWHGGPGQ